MKYSEIEERGRLTILCIQKSPQNTSTKTVTITVLPNHGTTKIRNKKNVDRSVLSEQLFGNSSLSPPLFYGILAHFELD